ncbi:bifunctional tRNA (5-methylaminomethyl-2-thiouridine)(34)-methyltransferase MnmD/FAD-dependent 5-carboxymethylaminomethyl-2-thiouridine(34) oxidoreductase MnmC [Neiella marina]|uniref:tRNA 5-methylaminomethyl-2-thiouridine biosynthesis bifunctional protein MnmC n=1 Tax=Neiella holothuriorum TaxID=2870530 RepID=A0ABS7EDJ8_9GAMM|nr:bifunctional tRNA (5-methylaminomethyl-2-thiouridine)(34)-methyltransferase MnmD/FAD-dependent 5-carboxymethylaminomethyl-2-thiouridine(34) oxidoreductase MnmC [Neiella holothuriorum]MBW8190412.1 bifunctional tRNA (5-methylaminomethyl-2-thiouridine)(34)-methyltransferase MnmD/FAD-dependent 5-carboxymethylaminomethyl-2-thiouridine(34) oxidoreductase MnmC [Neiella holothuriorum]
MSSSHQISSANLHFNAHGTPIADDFDDVYFSNDDGQAESQYVFIAGNKLTKRWRANSCYSFTVAETGFGTGLNFLACWQAFDDYLSQNLATGSKQLHFISFEKFPITTNDLQDAHQRFANLSHYASQLRNAYPQQLSAGCHRMSFAGGRVVLDLWLGDVNDIMPTLSHHNQGNVDAWFLDGFAPSKNPQMWQQSLFDQMFRLSRPHATVATFTAAGLVRRGLAEAGFEVSKQAGYGNKRDMTIATKTALPQSTQYRTDSSTEASSVAIIGGGIAACLTAWQLAQRGKQITLLCADEQLAAAASGNRQGALYPLLTPKPSELSQFYWQGFRQALPFYRQLSELAPSIRHQWCGLLHLSSNEALAKKHQEIASIGYPTTLVELVSAQQASALSGVTLPHEALYYPDGAWFCPGDICQFIGQWLTEHGHDVRLNFTVKALTQADDNWQLTGPETLSAAQVVVAAGIHSGQFEQTRHLPISAVRGQVSHVPATEASQQLKTVLCHTGYLTPMTTDDSASHCLGATFSREDKSEDLHDDDHQTNLQRLAQAMPDSELVNDWQTTPTEGRVGFRAVLRDHFPVVGPVPAWQQIEGMAQTSVLASMPLQQGLFVISGLGARGICSAPLAAAVVTDYICGEAQCLPQPILDAINPARFVWRRLKKNKPLFDQ